METEDRRREIGDERWENGDVRERGHVMRERRRETGHGRGFSDVISEKFRTCYRVNLSIVKESYR